MEYSPRSRNGSSLQTRAIGAFWAIVVLVSAVRFLFHYREALFEPRLDPVLALCFIFAVALCGLGVLFRMRSARIALVILMPIMMLWGLDMLLFFVVKGKRHYGVTLV